MAETTPPRRGAAAPATANETPAEQDQHAQPQPAPTSGSATAAGDDGTPRKLRVAGMQDRFGPITVDGTEYTLTRAGTNVAGAHVKAVRDSAKAHGVTLRSSKADDEPGR